MSATSTSTSIANRAADFRHAFDKMYALPIVAGDDSAGEDFLTIRVATDGTAGFQLSLDMDFVDPQDAPGVGTPVRGGVTYREAHLAMEMICDSGQMLAMEVVEVNPVIDEVNRTADLAVELVMSALGKRIL